LYRYTVARKMGLASKMASGGAGALFAAATGAAGE
jgi:hypothetical protein